MATYGVDSLDSGSVNSNPGSVNGGSSTNINAVAATKSGHTVDKWVFIILAAVFAFMVFAHFTLKASGDIVADI